MPLPFPSNVSVDIFRAGNGPGGVPATAALACYLTPKGQSTLTTPYYTHNLYLPTGTDIRDNFQAGSLVAGANSDAVYIPSGGAGTLYTVVLVREWNIGGPLDHLEALLIRGAVTGSGAGGRTNVCSVNTAQVNTTGNVGNVYTTTFKWGNVVFDPNSLASTVGTNGRITIATGGYYLVNADIEVNDGNVTGWSLLQIVKNGSTVVHQKYDQVYSTTNNNNNNGVVETSTVLSLNQGDYLTITCILYLTGASGGQTWTGNFSVAQAG
jgi:hypothetical protein